MTRTELKAKMHRKQELERIEKIAMASMLINGIAELHDYVYGLEEVGRITDDEAEQIYYSVCKKHDLRYADKTEKEIGKIRISEL